MLVQSHFPASWVSDACRHHFQFKARGKDSQRLLTITILFKLQVFFAATGVSDGDLLRGVRYFSGGASTNSIVMRSESGTGITSLARSFQLKISAFVTELAPF